MKRYLISGMGLVVVTVLAVTLGRYRDAQAHCQVPCGIYDDDARISRMLEDTTTIRKAATKINELADKTDAQNLNQLVRWVTTKEDHASNIIDIVSEYFLTQKVKPVAPDDEKYQAYLESLAVHHRVMVAAMKAKQTADPAAADALHEAIDQLAQQY